MIFSNIYTLSFIVTAIVILITFLWRRKSKEFKFLKDFPGDMPWPIVGNALQIGFECDVVANKLMDTWRRHGKTNFRVTFGQKHWVLLTEPHDIGILLSHPTELAKTPERNAAIIPFFGQSLSTSEEFRWRFFRKLMAPSVSYQTLDQRLIFVNDYCDKLIIKLRNQGSEKPIDLYYYVRPYMYDIFTSSLMGVKATMLDEPNHKYIEQSAKLIKIVTENYFSYWRHIDTLFKMSKYYTEMMEIIQEIRANSVKILEERRAILNGIKEDIIKNNTSVDIDVEKLLKEKISSDHCLLDELILSRLPNGDPITDEMILDEITLVCYTGHYTTTKTVTHTMYMVAKRPHIQKLIVEEQDLIFADDTTRKPTNADLAKMKYLEAVLKETMRYLPTVTKIGRELKNDLALKDGRTIPAGTSVSVFFEALFNHPELYPDGDKFRPERFLDSTLPAFAFVPFSSGPRNCLGFKYAWLTMKATLSTIFRKFEIREAGPQYEPQFKYRIITESTNGVHLYLKDRLLSNEI